jgi:hypothetical protein
MAETGDRMGQLHPSKRARPVGDAPKRARHPQIVGYRCGSPGKSGCGLRVVLSWSELESAIVAAMKEGRSKVRVGHPFRDDDPARVGLVGRYRGEPIRTTTRTVKAPIPGAYRRPANWPC